MLLNSEWLLLYSAVVGCFNFASYLLPSVRLRAIGTLINQSVLRVVRCFFTRSFNPLERPVFWKPPLSPLHATDGSTNRSVCRESFPASCGQLKKSQPSLPGNLHGYYFMQVLCLYIDLSITILRAAWSSQSCCRDGVSIKLPEFVF